MEEYPILLFDVDDTLYPPSSGVWPAIGERINQYMIEKMAMRPETVSALREKLYHTYGTTLRGLVELYHIDQADFLNFVHDVPVKKLINQEPKIREMLAALPHRKIIFTNADAPHARRVLETLCISDCFEKIIDIWDTTPYCKPFPEAFKIALRLADNLPPQNYILIDDSLPNLSMARQLGIQTILVGDKPQDPSNPHPVANCILELPEILKNGVKK
jgi:putative hydrolase of the HAD superfamily